MPELDLIVRNARVVTASDEFGADIGIARGVIIHLAQRLEAVAGDEIDAAGRTVTPGGIDGHCHIDQPSTDGSVCADDFASAARSAACGGTTTVIPFALQQQGMRLRDAVADYHRRAEGKALIDNARLHHDVDYTPYQGICVRAWPGITLARGEVVWAGAAPCGTPGRGRYLPCDTPVPARPAQRHVSAFRPA
jgi:dihydropyrimidinase